MSKHTGTSELEYGGETLIVHWTFEAGRPAKGLDPAEPDDVEITQVQLQHTLSNGVVHFVEILDMLEAFNYVDTILDELCDRGEFDDLDAGDPEPPDDFEDSAGYSRESAVGDDEGGPL